MGFIDDIGGAAIDMGVGWLVRAGAGLQVNFTTVFGMQFGVTWRYQGMYFFHKTSDAKTRLGWGELLFDTGIVFTY
jgi:hypothetical protein